MVELIGDVCQPSDLTIPFNVNYRATTAVSGAIVMSGAKLQFFTGDAWEVITSA